MQRIINFSKNLFKKKNILENQNRYWLKNKKELSEDEFIFMSYNILSEQYMFEQLYGNCNKIYLEWDYRKSLLDQELNEIKPDIILFQELEYDKISDIKLILNKFDNDLIYQQKVDKYNIEKRKDGLAISVNKNKFDILGSYYINFNFESYFYKVMDKKKNIKNIFKNLNYNNISLFSFIRNKKTNKIIWVLNNHLIFKRNKPIIKLLQILILLDIIKIFEKEYKIDYIFMGGDFNLIPNSMLYDMLTKHIINLNIESSEFSNQYRMLYHCNFNSPLLIQLIDSNTRFYSNGNLDDDLLKKITISLNLLRKLNYKIDKLDKNKVHEIVPYFNEDLNMVNDVIINNQFINIHYYEDILKKWKFKSLYSNFNSNINNKDLLKTDFKYLINNNKNKLAYENLISHFTIDFKATCDYIFYSGDIEVLNILSSPGYNYIKKLDIVPNSKFLSDHFSLVGIIKLK